MGAQIAAHFANAGVPSLLLDVTPEAAAQGLQRARTLKPDPFFTPDTWKLITTAGFDEGLGRLTDLDEVALRYGRAVDDDHDEVEPGKGRPRDRVGAGRRRRWRPGQPRRLRTAAHEAKREPPARRVEKFL